MGLALTSADSDGPTIAICNAIEKTACETTYEDEVAANCPGAKLQNLDYFNQLKDSCAISVDGESGDITPPPASDSQTPPSDGGSDTPTTPPSTCTGGELCADPGQSDSVTSSGQ